MLGLQWKALSARAVLAGVITGVAVAVTIMFGPEGKPYGIHAGIWGLAANFLVLPLVQFSTCRGRTGTPLEAR